MTPESKHQAPQTASRIIATVLLLAGMFLAAVSIGRAAQLDIDGPVGSGQFGTNVAVLPNGNFVVTDPGYDAPGPIANVGAVYLYDGVTLAVISTLTGSTVSDQVGNGGVTVLSNGNYVVSSTNWDNGAATDAGAVTWGSGTSGVSGTVSAANSLVGSTANDRVGSDYFGRPNLTALTNGNYVVSSRYWDNGAATDAGAVTWGSGSGGTTGAISAANSLVGSTANDVVGEYFATLNNGHYVVVSPFWDNGAATDAGAVTWGNGSGGTTGAVSAANSLVGSTASKRIGLIPTSGNGVTALNNGNYVVHSHYAGAVTWGNGFGGTTGAVSAANSLVGAGGSFWDFVTALNNGNYVVVSASWANGAVVNAGAVTWGNGLGGTTGAVSAANSLVGSQVSDSVGFRGVTALNNGNYVVACSTWDNGSVIDAGAVTWGNGLGGTTGAVSAANSLVGSTAGDQIGSWGEGVTTLSNGNYVVSSPFWNNGAATEAGAATWGNGSSGTTGAVSAANSLVGSTANDHVSILFYPHLDHGVTALNNGNYVVGSGEWDNGAVADAGAVTWGNGSGGTTGAISAANSLVGSTAFDYVGTLQNASQYGTFSGVTALNNGNYVVVSAIWDNGTATDAGAVTWGNGSGGTAGAVSAANSLVGSTAGDTVGAIPSGYAFPDDDASYSGVTALNNGNYVVGSGNWDNGAATDAGAVTWGNGSGGTVGAVSAANSLVGSQAGDRVGSWHEGATALNNGHYVVSSPFWVNGAAANAGAATWGNGSGGTVGAVSSANSLVGSAAFSYVGWNGVAAWNNGNYAVRSWYWDNGATANAGAASLGHGQGMLAANGEVTATNSVLGTVAGGGASMNVAYDYFHRRLVVGYPGGNRVSLLSDPYVPRIAVLGTNGLALANGEGASRGEGTDFGHLLVGGSLTNTLSITNAGGVALTISGWTTNGAGAAAFVSDGIPASVPAYSAAQFQVAFRPFAAGTIDASLLIANDATNFTVNLRGSAVALSTNVGPFAGGSTITITNGTLGSGADITNVLVGGVAATISGQGTDWVTLTVPPIGSAGVNDIVIQSASAGDTTLAGVYTVNPAGQIGGVVEDWTQWEEVVGLPAARWGLAAGVLNGELYAMGGSDASSVAQTNVYRYDGAHWTEVAGLPVERSQLAAGVLDGALYAVGGYDASSVARTNAYRYNGTNWTEVAGLPAPRGDLAAAALNGALYAIGGRPNYFTGLSSNVYRYNGANWTEVAGLPAPRGDLAAAVLNGALYAVGGVGPGVADVHRYDGTNWTGVASLPAESDALAAGVLNGALYAVGGLSLDHQSKSNVYRYDGTNWTESVALPLPRFALAAGVLNGQMYAVGGYDDTSAPLSEYRYPRLVTDPGVSPSTGSYTGGYPVVITGSNLGNGADITNVTICGALASIVSQSATQVVVTAGPAVLGLGHVAVSSTSYGTTIKSNAFRYTTPITVWVGPHGVVTPSGLVDVVYGGGTNFVVSADEYYHIGSLLTNGSDVGAAADQRAYTSVWLNVRAAGALAAIFAENLTTNTATPEWWLAQFGWTDNFADAATNDVDADGMRTWTEYLAGTDPTNETSFLGFDRIEMEPGGTGIVVHWQSVDGKRYRIDRSTNLLSNPVFDQVVRTNILGGAPMNTETDTTATGQGPYLYRVGLQ